MKKTIFPLILFLFALLFSMPSNVVVAHADMGPKPDMIIDIYNLEKSDYIIAYGFQDDRYAGPHHPFIPGDDSEHHYGETYYGNVDDLTLIYNHVTLPEGWDLCDISSSYTNTTKLHITSGYMWPSEFVLIIYNKITNDYYLSEETKTYAFHSYFKFDMKNYKDSPIALEGKFELERSYNYAKEILEFILRLLATLSIEMLLALAFRFNKKSLLIIALTNVITQVVLNVWLNIEAYFNGKSLWFIVLYAFIEIFIVITEAIVYKIFCRRGKEENRSWIIVYAILANVLSFFLGMLLWLFI